jgi:ankyrin repeat protein
MEKRLISYFLTSRPLHILSHMTRNKDTLEEIAGMFLELQPDVNIKDKNNKTALLLACEAEQWKYVTKLIFDGKADINLVPGVSTPLHHAVFFKEMTTLRSLLKLQADIHILDSQGRTPIDISALKKDKDLTVMLLKHDPNIDPKRENAKHYIPILMELDQIKKIKEIIDQDPEIANYEWDHPEAKIQKCSLIAGAIEQGSLDIVKMLIENYKVNVNATIEQTIHNQSHSFTPLHLAIMKNQPGLVKMLIEVGADCSIPTEPDKLSPLMLACKNKLDIDTIKLILNCEGVDFNVLAGDESNLLHFAASANNIELFKEFIEKGLDLHNTTKKKQTVLASACLSGSLEMTKYLVEELNLDIRGSGEEDFITDSYPPLHCSVLSGNKGLVEYLLKKSVELLGTSFVDQCNIDGQMRAIHLASLNGKTEIAKLLIDTGCDLTKTIQISGDKGVNALHLACGYGFAEIVNYLLDAGMDVNSETLVQKSTPLHFALRRMKLEIVKNLKERGAMSDGAALQLAVQTGQVEVLDLLDSMKSPRMEQNEVVKEE